MEPGREFGYKAPHLIVAVKFIGRADLPLDTLYVIVKDINGVAGRFYMKRSQKALKEANALVRIKADGIYRVYVYNPKQRARPISHGTVYITSDANPTVQALLERQRKILVERGVIKDTKASDPYTATESGADTPTETTVEDEFEDLDFAFEDSLEGDDEFSDDEFDANTESIEEDFNLEDDIAPEDFSGEYESFDELDDEFNFEIDDF